MAKRLLNGLGYLPLIIAAAAACWFHHAIFPNVIRGASAIDPNVALPEGPFLLSFLGIASAWFPSLGKAWVVGTLGALFALFLLFYTYLLTTPLLMNASWSSR